MMRDETAILDESQEQVLGKSDGNCSLLDDGVYATLGILPSKTLVTEDGLARLLARVKKFL